MKAGRNDPCPCGSSKKYKHCCHAKDTVPARQQHTSPKTSKINQLVVLFEAERFADVEALALEIVEQHPNSGFAWKLLGAALMRLNKESLSALQKAAAFLPDDVEVLAHLGSALTTLGRYEEAMTHFNQAIDTNPNYGTAYSLQGVALQSQSRYEEAIACFEKALRLDGQSLNLLNNLGISLTALGRLDEAVKMLRKGIQIDPTAVRFHQNLASALMVLGDFEGSFAGHAQALALQPGDPALHINRAYAYLCLGLLKQGWADYDYRLLQLVPRHPELPFWAGEDLSGKSILIWGEQGIGDELMFASMYAEVIERAAHCVIECHAKLLSLFTRTFPGARVVVKTQPRHPDIQVNIDFQSPAGSLARWLRPTLDSFPQQEGYVVPDPQRVQYWRNRLEEIGPGPKIGFCWRSMLRTEGRELNYTTLDLWGPIFKTPSVHFVNLQYDDCDAELNAARAQFGIPLYSFPEIDLLNDLDEAAAFTQALDLVISAGTATSVIGAALGKPTWLMAYTKSWTMLGTNYMPWFPMQRNFCRQWHQPWDDVIAEIAQLLGVAIGATPSVSTTTKEDQRESR